MKIFLDSADVKEIREVVELGVIDGVTTNPSLIAQTRKPVETVAREICELVDGPISLEVISTESQQMIREGRALAALHHNVVVKIPMIREGLKALRALASEGIRVNMTLIFTPLQALLAAKNGAAFVSPFVGRLDDLSVEGTRLISDTLQIFKVHGFETEVLVASIRHPLHFLEIAKMGADAATVPRRLLEHVLKHPLTESGLEKFLSDWRKGTQ